MFNIPKSVQKSCCNAENKKRHCDEVMSHCEPHAWQSHKANTIYNKESETPLTAVGTLTALLRNSTKVMENLLQKVALCKVLSISVITLFFSLIATAELWAREGERQCGNDPHCIYDPDDYWFYKYRCVNNVCKECAYGYGQNPSTGLCTPCADSNCWNCQLYGDYRKCRQCKDGYGFNDNNRTGCVPCSISHIPHCTECDPGNLYTKCRYCEDGYRPDDSQENCVPLPEGCLYGDEYECLRCAKGYYFDYSGYFMSCTKCPNGTTTSREYAHGIDECEPFTCDVNEYVNGNDCSECASYQYSSGGTTTSCTNLNCSANYYAKAHTCVECEAGTSSSGGTTTSCTAFSCGDGQYVSGHGCATCSAGTYKSGNNTESSCTNCDSGSYSAAGASTCTACATAGKYWDGSSCATCPEGYQCTGNGVSSQCSAGTYAAAGASACATCSAGSYSEAGAKSCTACGDNTWAAAGSSECMPNTAEHCASKSTTANVCSSCAANYFMDGTTCTAINCSAGEFFDMSAKVCKPCVEGEWNDVAAATSCMPNTAANCATFSKTANVCSSCAAKFKFVDNECVKMTCAEVYDGSSETQCETTTSGCSVTTCSEVGSLADGTKCYKSTTTDHTPSCDTNASIIGEGASCACVCNTGFEGSGTTCTAISCPAGKYLDGSECKTCPAGTFSGAGDNVCSSCGAHEYSAAGASSCLPRNNMSNCNSFATDSDECTSCKTGYKQENGGCVSICNGGKVFWDGECYDEYPFAKKRYTPAEADQWLKDTGNVVTLIFKK